jgi:gamma-glutamyl hydrolase
MIGVIASPKINSTTASNIKYAKSYVKWIESSGAKAVIIPYNVSLQKLLDILTKIRGIVFIGGAIENKKLYSHEQYITYVTTLYQAYTRIKKYNEEGRHFPIWGTCLGFEMLMLFHQHKPLEHLFDSMKIHEKNDPSTLSLLPSRVQSFFPKDILQEMKTRPCVTHHHKYGFDIQSYKNITIVSTDSDFINMIEWPEMIKVLLPENALFIDIIKQIDDSRKLIIFN